jgi:hypothetical protein
MRDWSVEYRFEPLKVAFPRFPADAAWVSDARKVQGAAAGQIARNKDRLTALEAQLESEPEAPAASRNPGLPVLSKWDVARLCEIRADCWKQARDAVAPADASAPTSPAALGGAVSRA